MSIEFYFDFSSPYGYLAAFRIDELAERVGHEVTWYPYLMGAALKVTGSQPLVNQPLVGEYVKRDLKRCSRLYDLPFNIPSRFPVPSVAACRAFYWLQTQDDDAAKDLARAIYRAYFVDDRNIAEVETVVAVAHALGIDQEALTDGLQSPEVKAKLREVTDGAIEGGIFGSPFFVVGSEHFWGNDRLEQMEQWITSNGW